MRNLQVQRVEEEDHIFSLVVFQRDFLELAINHGNALEFGSRLLQIRYRHLVLYCRQRLKEKFMVRLLYIFNI